MHVWSCYWMEVSPGKGASGEITGWSGAQATQQGGVVIFDGTQCVLEHKDRATGAHIDLQRLLDAATPLAK
jgi:hypothetical protein